MSDSILIPVVTVATDLGKPVGAMVPSGMDQAETTAKDDGMEVAPTDATTETPDKTATDAGKRMIGYFPWDYNTYAYHYSTCSIASFFSCYDCCRPRHACRRCDAFWYGPSGNDC